MRNVTGEELLGYCENRFENDKKVEGLKEQIKALNTDSSEMTKATAEDFEVVPKHLNKVYKEYKDVVSKGKEEMEDYYTMIVLLEQEMEKENFTPDV